MPNLRPLEFETPGEARELALANLKESINRELRKQFEENKSKGREYLADLLVNFVEGYVYEFLNKSGYSFGRISYSGDINFEDSEQIFSDGERECTGIILTFCGFSCEVEWVDAG